MCPAAHHTDVTRQLKKAKLTRLWSFLLALVMVLALMPQMVFAEGNTSTAPSVSAYEIIAGHRRQRASELAGFANMPCIVRNMTDDEAILAMTDDNLRHRERILPTEKAQSLKMQVEAIKHQGSRPGEEDKDAGKRSTQVVGDRNGMNYKQVQR